MTESGKRRPGMVPADSAEAIRIARKEILEKFDDRITDPEIRTRLNRYAYYQENRQCRKELMQDEEIARRTGESMRALRTKVLMKVF